jgi:hypothetical protein
VNTLFLTPAEIRELTGLQRPAAQCRWLARNGYRFEVGGDRQPKVMRAQLEARQGITSPARPTGPDFSALDRLG